MSSQSTYYTPNRCVNGTLGVVSLFGFVIYEYLKIKSILRNVIDLKVLDKETKRPDYIYIKYHIYRESMEKMKRKQEENSKWINIFINPIGKWWKKFKHTLALRILIIAQNGDKTERSKAIRLLTKCADRLKDWEFCNLAQICDATTAASLAHSGCDIRWFVPICKINYVKNPKLILSELNAGFNELMSHMCVKHFMKKFIVSPVVNKEDPKHIKKAEMKTFSEYATLKEYTSFLMHLSKHPDITEKLVEQGLLANLLELKKMFESEPDALIKIGKCVSNISAIPKFVNDFFVTGWIRIFAEWRNHPDIRLQMFSAKALSNLDLDDMNHKLCAPNIYQLYPVGRVKKKPKCDVIFLHGLLGGVFITWRQKNKTSKEIGLFESLVAVEEPIIHRHSTGKDLPSPLTNRQQHYVETMDSNSEIDDWEIVFPDCPEKSTSNKNIPLSVPGAEWYFEELTNEYTHCWPMDWLPQDCPNIRILAIDYVSTATEWSSDQAKDFPCEKERCDLEGRSNYFLEMLSICNIGDNVPIIWIGHSMGGLITKKMLIKADMDYNENIKRIAKNTNAIIFLGTPHRGSAYGKWRSTAQSVLAPSIEVLELGEDNPMLIDLHEKFMKLLNEKYNKINITSFAEGSPTMLTSLKVPLTIVTEQSANIDYGDYFLLNYDHLSLSKPFYRQSFLYQRILQIIQEALVKKRKRCKN